MAPKILIVQRHPLFIEAVRSCINVVLRDAVVESASDVMAAAHMLSGQKFKAILLDLSTTDARGLRDLIALRILRPEIPVIVFADAVSDSLANSARACGAVEIVTKAASRKAVIDVLRSALVSSVTRQRAKGVLSKAELRVLQLMSDGLFNKQIAYDLGITEQTVKAHVTQIMRKMRVTFRTQAVAKLGDIERLVWRSSSLDSYSGVQFGAAA
jgi:DNA-binding NarL/FixJ family response regulator